MLRFLLWPSLLWHVAEWKMCDCVSEENPDFMISVERYDDFQKIWCSHTRIHIVIIRKTTVWIFTSVESQTFIYVYWRRQKKTDVRIWGRSLKRQQFRTAACHRCGLVGMGGAATTSVLSSCLSKIFHDFHGRYAEARGSCKVCWKLCQVSCSARHYGTCLGSGGYDFLRRLTYQSGYPYGIGCYAFSCLYPFSYFIFPSLCLPSDSLNFYIYITSSFLFIHYLFYFVLYTYRLPYWQRCTYVHL
jgi:hypothetical protein